jgi:AcrR family transcriptional regulator
MAMARRTGARAEPRIPLSRERVLRAAIGLADEGGIEALSMRRLGQELRVEAMSLYNHVTNKDDLLDGIADLVLSEIELPSKGEDWRAALRRNAISAHDVLIRHRWACSLAMSPARNIPVRVRQMDWMLGRLRGSGFSAELTYHAYHALDSHIMGFTLWELGHALDTKDIRDLAATFLRVFPADDYPYVAEHVEQHLTGFGGDGEGAFTLVLDLILAGLERMRDTA